MSVITNKLIFDLIKQHYRPYEHAPRVQPRLLGLPSWQLPQPAQP